MPYKILPFKQDEFHLEPKVAKHPFADKTGHEKGKELIEAKVRQIQSNPLAFNGEKALFYFKDEELEDGNILKIVPEDYASVSAALEVNRNPQSIAAAKEQGQFLRSHYVAGVIVVCQTVDDKIIIGSRDANRDKVDPTKYPLQFPCGFIDVNEDFYNEIRQGNPELLYQTLISDAKRELREEVLNFDDEQISHTQILAAIYETKQWPIKAEKGGGTKDVHIIKSFAIKVDVNMTYAQIEESRDAAIKKLQEDLNLNPDNKDFLQQKKDFDEMTKMGFIDVRQLSEILARKVDGTKVEIDFDGVTRKFVAEHGMTLDALSQHLEATIPKNSPRSSSKEPLDRANNEEARSIGN